MRILYMCLMLAFLVLRLPAQESPQYQRVRAFIDNYQYSQAIRLAEQLFTSDTSQTGILLLEGEAMTAIFRFREAEAVLLRAWKTDTTDIRVMNQLAGLYRQTGETEKAFRCYRKILEHDAGNEYVYLQMASLYSLTENYKSALDLLLPLYAKDSTSFYLLKQIAAACQELKNPDSALLFYTRAHMLNPSDPGVTVKVINLLIRRKAYDSALSVSNKYLLQNPSVYSVLRLNAYATYLIKDYPGAAERFRRAIRLGDASKFTQKYLGLSRYKLEMYDSAAPFFRRAYMLDTTDTEVCFYYGVSAIRSLNPDTGLLYLNKTFHMLMPSNEYLLTLYSELAGAYNLTNRPDTALDFLMKAHNTDPGDPVIIFKIAYQYDYYLRKHLIALPWYNEFLKKKSSEDEMEQNLPQVVSYTSYARNRIKELNAYKNSNSKSK